MPFLQASIPPSIRISVSQDRSTTIRASVHDIEVTLVISVLLVILVVFAFLRSVWATAIPSIAVPLSLVGTFGVMYLAGYTIDNISLMALTISTGFVVDDAIVVIENITRHLEKGMASAGSRSRGLARDWLYRTLHEHLADRRLYPDSLDGRHCGPHVPRICHHLERRRSHFPGRFADHHTDHVRQAA